VAGLFLVATPGETMPNCKFCGDEIIWLKSSDGRNIPVEADDVLDGEDIFEPDFMINHLDICKKLETNDER